MSFVFGACSYLAGGEDPLVPFMGWVGLFFWGAGSLKLAAHSGALCVCHLVSASRLSKEAENLHQSIICLCVLRLRTGIHPQQYIFSTHCVDMTSPTALRCKLTRLVCQLRHSASVPTGQGRFFLYLANTETLKCQDDNNEHTKVQETSRDTPHMTSRANKRKTRTS